MWAQGVLLTNRCRSASNDSRCPQGLPTPWLRNGKFSVERRLGAAKAQRLPGAAPFIRQGIWRCDAVIGLKAETPVIGRIAEYVDLVRAGVLQTSQAGANNCTANTLPLPLGSNGERSQERNLVRSSGNAACREDHMSHQSLTNDPDKRDNARSFSLQFPYKRQQVLIRECLRIQLLDRGDVFRQAFAYFNIPDHVPPCPRVTRNCRQQTGRAGGRRSRSRPWARSACSPSTRPCRRCRDGPRASC